MASRPLVIVESPAKAKTLGRFLGAGYRVEASFGHIRDLPESAADVPKEIKEKDWGRMGVDVESDFTPYYVVPGDKKKTIKKKGPKVWPSVKAFRTWRANHLAERREAFRDKLTPLQYYVTQGLGHERAFTGDHWWTKDVGIYSCVCCSQRVFMSDHKYENKSGYPTFWNHIIDAVDFKNDGLTRPDYAGAFEDPTLKNKRPHHRIICSNCESTLGYVYDDGPPPFFKRF